MQQVNVSLFKNAVAFTMTMKRFSNRRQGSVGALLKDKDASGAETATDKKRLKLSKQLIDSPEYDAIAAYQAEVYQYLTMRSVPSFFKDGLYLVRLSEVENFEAKLKEAKEKLALQLVPALVDAYPNQIDEARIALNGQFNIKDYPLTSELPARFGVEWNWIAFGVPDELPAELRAAEAAKIEKQFKEAEVQIMDALREGFAGIVSHVADRLDTKPGEKKKIFRDTLFADLTKFVATFSARNLVNDTALAELVTTAQGILAQVRGDTVEDKAQNARDNEGLRASTAEKFAAMRTAVDQMIIDKPARKFDFDA